MMTDGPSGLKRSDWFDVLFVVLLVICTFAVILSGCREEPGVKTCCQYCQTGQPCGDACIDPADQCHQPAGCACAGTGPSNQSSSKASSRRSSRPTKSCCTGTVGGGMTCREIPVDQNC